MTCKNQSGLCCLGFCAVVSLRSIVHDGPVVARVMGLYLPGRLWRILMPHMLYSSKSPVRRAMHSKHGHSQETLHLEADYLSA